MAILFVTHKFPPDIGGMQRQSYELVNGIKKYTKVYLIAQSPIEPKIWFFMKLRFKILKMLKYHPEIETIHCNDGVMAAFVALFVKVNGIQFCCTYHGLDLVYPNSVYQKYIIPKVHKFSSFFCVSHYTAEECLRRGFDKDRIHVIPNGVDFKLAEIKSDPNFYEDFRSKYKIDLSQKKIVLAIGRAVKRKGFSWFISNVLPRLDSNVTFIMIGPIDKAKSITSKILKHLPSFLSESIELFTGYASDSQEIYKAIGRSNSRAIHLKSIPYSELVQLLSNSDVFVMPNLSVKGDMEGFGLVALEANLRNCPVVVSAIEGITSAVKHMENGIYVKSSDSQAWVETVNDLLSNKQLSDKLIASAKDFVKKHYSWNLMAKRYYLIFERSKNRMEKQIEYKSNLSKKHSEHILTG